MVDKTQLYAGMYNTKGYKLSCLLNEGNFTLGKAKDANGSPIQTYAFASELSPGDIVCLDTSDYPTFEATGGSVVVKKLEGDGKAFGVVLTDIDWVGGLRPTQSVSGNLDDLLAAGVCRVATIEVWENIMVVKKGTLTGTNTTKIVPGDSAKLMIDIDAQIAQTDGKVCVKDVASGGAGMIALNAVPVNNGDTYNLLVGITGQVVGDKA